jgi:hypothetical protein
MKISEAKTKYIFTTKIELEEGDYIVLREPSIQEMQMFSGDDKDKKNTEAVEKLFPICLVEHSFYEDDSKTKAGNDSVYEMLKDSASLFTEIVDIWFKSIPFQSRLKKPKK